jgi:hypothetical protein
MMPKNGYNYYQIRVSLERALNVLGDSSKQTLMFHMAKHYGISFDRGCSIREIEVALRGILGSGAAIITDRMYRELQAMPE